MKFGFFEKHLGGHINLGSITVYGANAMHWAVNIQTKRWGYVCFRLPFRCLGCWWPLYLYCSPNGTPGASTFYYSFRASHENQEAAERRRKWGHNYNTELLYGRYEAE